VSARFDGTISRAVPSVLVPVGFFGNFADRKCLILNWLPPRDSNPDMLIQRQETDDSAEFLRFD
jgi:hypothetical protein